MNVNQHKWYKMLHLGDPAFTATVLTQAAIRRGYDWRVKQWVTTEQHSSQLLTTLHKATRGLAWEAQFARRRMKYSLIHLHSALALPHVSWALGTYALHLHGTDIRVQQYKEEFRSRVLTAIEGAAVVYYSTPDLKEHTLIHRPDAILAPVPVASSATPMGTAPTQLRGADYIFFTSRWDPVKGGEDQINLVRSLRAKLDDSIHLVGVDWGSHAEQACLAGVTLIPKQRYPDFLATIAGSRMAIGQLTGVMGASELDALDMNIPLVMPLNLQWYDGSSPSLVAPPVIGAGIAPDDADGLTDVVLEALDTRTYQDSHSWIQQHHSPDAVLDIVLDGYERYL